MRLRYEHGLFNIVPAPSDKCGSLVDEEGFIVAEVNKDTGTSGEEIAAVIVRAVNGHDALLTALREIVVQCDGPANAIASAAVRSVSTATPEGKD